MTPPRYIVRDNGLRLELVPPSWWGDIFGGWFSVEWLGEGE